VPGWKAYFRLAKTPQILRELDQWLRHRLRAIQLKQRRRDPTIYRDCGNWARPKTRAPDCRAGTKLVAQ
jgi:hypothetical protein